MKKGPKFEADIVGWLQAHGFPHAHRIVSGSVKDKGDVGGVPLVMELKNQRSVELGSWWNEASREADNAGMVRRVVVHKRRGVADPGEQWVTMTVWMLADLLGMEVSA